MSITTFLIILIISLICFVFAVAKVTTEIIEAKIIQETMRELLK